MMTTCEWNNGPQKHIHDDVWVLLQTWVIIISYHYEAFFQHSILDVVVDNVDGEFYDAQGAKVVYKKTKCPICQFKRSQSSRWKKRHDYSGKYTVKIMWPERREVPFKRVSRDQWLYYNWGFQAAMSLAFLFAWLPSVIVNAYSLKHADKLKDLQWQFDPLVSKGCRKK